MKTRFVLKLGLFSLPIALIIAIPLGLAFYVGETMPFNLIATMQAQDRSLIYGPRFGRDMFAFNLLIVNQRQPRILATGSSRAWFLRSGLFHKAEAEFYNASDAGWTLDEIDTFLRQIDPNALPEVLLLGIDQPWFNPDFVSQADRMASAPDEINTIATARGLVGFVLQSSDKLSALLGRTDPVHGGMALGVDATTNGLGIRYDGSLQHGAVILGTAPVAVMRAQHHELLQSGAEMFVPGAQVSASTLSQLDSLLGYAQAQDIEVIGFAPPFAPGIYETMLANGDHAYLQALNPILNDLFAQYGFLYLDFTDPASVAAVEDDFWDGWHASELIAARMVATMMRATESLSPYSDLDFLEATIANPVTTFDIFANASEK